MSQLWHLFCLFSSNSSKPPCTAKARWSAEVHECFSMEKSELQCFTSSKIISPPPPIQEPNYFTVRLAMWQDCKTWYQMLRFLQHRPSCWRFEIGVRRMASSHSSYWSRRGKLAVRYLLSSNRKVQTPPQTDCYMGPPPRCAKSNAISPPQAAVNSLDTCCRDLDVH